MIDFLFQIAGYGFILAPFAFFWCCCGGPGCSCSPIQPGTINVQFTGFVNGSCVTCNNYNTTIYSIPTGGANCGTIVEGGCILGPSVGDRISLGLLPGMVRITVRDASAIPIGVFELAVSDPWDCRTTQILPRVSGFSGLSCDTTGATCQIN